MSQLSRVFFSNSLLTTITGDAGGALSPDGAGNINIIGDGTITTSGAGNTLTINLGGALATSYLTDDANSAIPALNVLTVAGGTNIGTTSAGSTVTINLDDVITLGTINANIFQTRVAATGLAMSGNSIVANGTDADIDINITAKGTGKVVINDLSLGAALDVPNGGTGAAMHTPFALLSGAGAASLSPIAVGDSGKLLMGVSANYPTWTASTYPDSVAIGDVLVASAADTIGVVTGAAISGYLLTANGAGTAPTFQAPAPSGVLSVSSTYLDVTDVAGAVTVDTYAVLQSDTGFESWSAAGPYFDDTVLGDFELLVGGTGYIKGVPVTWAGGQTVSGLTAGNTYLIYIDDTGTIGKTTSFDLATFQDYIPLFQCMRDSTLPTNNQVTVKENHPYDFPVAVSIYAHNTIGCIIENHSGGANITLNGTQKIEIVGTDELSDHGLYTTIPDSAGVAVDFVKMHTDASGKWVRQNYNDTFTGYYNNAGTATVLDANKYGVYTLYVSKDNLNSSIPVYGAVLDTSQYSNLAAADAAISNGTTAVATNEVAKLENSRLGYIIYQKSTDSIIDVVISKETLTTGSSLGGTNQASLVVTNVTNFDGILDSADTTVQAALETIDEWGKTTTDHALLLGNGTGVAIGSLAVGATGETLMGSTGADPTWTGSPSFSGSVTSGTGVTVTTGDVDVSSGSLKLPTTTSADGQIIQNGTRLIHSYGLAADYNVFIGNSSGNFTLTPGTAKYNFGFGYNTLNGLTSGSRNVCIGTSSGANISTGEYNTTIGNATFSNGVSTGSYNTCIGQASGYSYTSSESSNVCIANTGTVSESNTIHIGTQGTGNGQQDTTYIAGIYGVTPTGGNDGLVVTDSNGQLGSTLTPTVTSLTTTGSVTAGTGVTVTTGDVDVSSGSINLPTTTATDGQITINASRYLHAYGTNSVFLGKEAGNFTLTGNNNLGLGYQCLKSVTSGQANNGQGSQTLPDLTSGSYNTAIGQSALFELIDSDHNAALGNNTLGQLLHGSHNLALGRANTYAAGYLYTDSESYNICLCHEGVAAESGKIRIGNSTNHNACYIAGIYGVTPGGTLNVAYVDSNGQLGSVASLGVANGGTGAATLTDHGVLLGSGTGAITATAVGSTGEVLIGTTGADASWSSTPTVTTMNATTFDTNVAAAGLTLTGTTLAADGTDANIDIVITPKGTGTIQSLPVYGKSIGGTNAAVLVDDTGLFGTTTSSKRFKENIYDMDSYSSSILDLRPVVFNYKNDLSKRRQYGLIAEEVMEHMPLLVNLDDEGLPYNVKYHDLPQLLLNELIKQSKKISSLEDRLESLEAILKGKGF